MFEHTLATAALCETLEWSLRFSSLCCYVETFPQVVVLRSRLVPRVGSTCVGGSSPCPSRRAATKIIRLTHPCTRVISTYLPAPDKPPPSPGISPLLPAVIPLLLSPGDSSFRCRFQAAAAVTLRNVRFFLAQPDLAEGRGQKRDGSLTALALSPGTFTGLLTPGSGSVA